MATVYYGLIIILYYILDVCTCGYYMLYIALAAVTYLDLKYLKLSD